MQSFDVTQVILITDPVLATHIVRSRMMDKFRFAYHLLDPVRCGCLLSRAPQHADAACVTLRMPLRMWQTAAWRLLQLMQFS